MKDPLYIHLHLFKTAGYTFRYHVQKNLKPDEHLLLTYDLLGISSATPPKNPKAYREAAFKYLKTLTKAQKSKIKLIHGHLVPYGVHKFFDREPRYFTFVRNPVDRTISMYNYLCDIYQKDTRIGDERRLLYYEDKLLIKGKIPSFRRWLTEKYESDYKRNHLSLVGYLKEMGYLVGGMKSKKAIEEATEKFYFIGLTKNFSDDSLFFFEKLGMHKYFVDQNISPKRFGNKLDSKLLSKLVSQNKYCEYLYEISEEKNTKFKLDNPEFYEIVKRKRLERKILLPFTQTIFAPRQTILRFFSRLVKNESIIADPTQFSESVKLN